MKSALLLAVAALIATIAPARAADVSRAFEIQASGFFLNSGPDSDSPVDPVELNFTLTFDPSVSIEPTTAGLKVNAFNLPYPVEYAYVASATEPALVLGSQPGISPPRTECVLGPGSWCLNIFDPLDVPGPATAASFDQVTPDGSDWTTQIVTASLVVGTSVPEPGTWALLLVGFAVLAGAGSWTRLTYRRSRRSPAQ
jgi:hypothetical protein